MSDQRQVLDPAGMQERREAYFAFAREQGAWMFNPDGTYGPDTERDGRIAYWILPAFLHSPDPRDRERGLAVYSAGAGWNAFDVFMTSLTAAHLVRHHAELTPALRRRSEEHLSRFTVADNGRKPSAGVYDYMFHGYNDNMPAMSTRTMLFAGQVLGRRDFTDLGLFHLEGLCAHFHRRGLLSEHTSATYTPITLVSLLDVAELAADPAAREMAQACANRILLDVIGHWHWTTGSTGGTMSRAYTADVTETLSIENAYLWFLSGHPMTIDPRKALSGDAFEAPIHHARNRAFNVAQFVEVMNAAHSGVPAELVRWARAPRPDPYEIRATSDWGESGPGGAREVLTRSHQRHLWWLATTSTNATGGVAGQTLVLHGALASVPKPQGWRDRVAFWHRLIADEPDHGEAVVHKGASPHAGAFGQEGPRASIPAESDHITDWGRYQTLQKAGTALVLGAIGPNADGREIANLRFGVYFTPWQRKPDEVWEGATALPAWEGAASPKAWQFLRFGDVYVGLRFSGIVEGQALPVRRVWAGRYLKLEMPLWEGAPRTVDAALRQWAEFGYVMELGSRDEAGSFEAFRREVLAGTWEWHHNFYRSSRSIGRGGELQIVDSVLNGTARFMAVDGVVETLPVFEATGLDPALTRLFPDGHRVKQRRITYRNAHVVTPFYDRKSQVLEADVPDGLPIEL